MQGIRSFIRRQNLSISLRKMFNANYNYADRTLIRITHIEPISLCSESIYCRNSYSSSSNEHLVDVNTFEKVCEETLESLADHFERLIENEDKLASADVSYSSGVLTVNLGKHGTYVINRQSPNRQIWLSSPLSGPKRYDYLVTKGCWIYTHDNKTLFELLEKEISDICGKKVDFTSFLHNT